MVRNRILAALLALPLAACTVEDSDTQTSARADDVGTLSTADIKAALSVVPNAQVLGTHADGVPFLVRGEFGSTGQSLNGLVARDAHSRLAESLQRIAPIFRLNATDLVVRRTSVDAQGNTHVRYAQMKQGRPVVAHELVVHVNAAGLVYAANGSARDGEMVATKAMVAQDAASKAALVSTEGTGLKAESAQLVYYRAEQDGPLKLAYEVVVTGEGATLPIRDHVFVDAVAGGVLGRATDIHSAISRAVYTANNRTSLPGTLKRSEGGAVTGDAHIDENYDHLGTTYNCYKENFGRDSYNNAGAQLKSTVHYDSNYTNAFWNGSQMVYGDSNGTDAGQLGKSLDVTVHELTHAVTSSESNLTYSNESGALNEGMSDIFAAYCESWTKGWSVDAPIWMIGDDIWTPNIPGDALRYMGNPTQDGSSKDYYPERYTGSSDNGGVHWNSGIANLAFKLLSTGGKHPRGKTTTDVTGIGVQKAGAIFYRANAEYMTPSTTFAQAKAYTVTAATDLGHDTAAVTAAWEAVGVGGTVTPPPPACSTTVVLANGTALTGISVGAGEWSCTYTLTVPAGATGLKFDMSGGTGDADMYVKFGSVPTESSYDCRPYASGNTESCPVTTAQAGTYYVKLKGYSAASGISLKGAFTTGGTGGGDVLTNGVATAPFSGATGSWTCYTLAVPSGRTSATFTQATTGSGDADLYVRLGSKPTTSSYNCRPYKTGSAESCTLSSPAAGTYYVCSYAYSAFTNVTLKGAY
ncbi:M4 family metallopeptidase [Archangium primigenium]|uniref:M4 family metallopeptidase n=1 Tax=[Archangium] primigenium TaxID=2792470 RepID=UPI001958B426|nr:M4 family metallopeptidase [Archangium primigenium]MBM7117310.1 M4 family metallopeptidase [Archangium primigenium]